MRYSSSDHLCCSPRKGGVVVCLTDWVRVPGGFSRKSMRHWEDRSGFSVSLLLRASSWVIPEAGTGLGLTPGLLRSRLSACVTSSLEGCGDYTGPPWPGKCSLRPSPVISGASGKPGCPVTINKMCRWLSVETVGDWRILGYFWGVRVTGALSGLTWGVSSNTDPCPCSFATWRFWAPFSLGLSLLSFCPCPFHPSDLAVNSVSGCFWRLPSPSRVSDSTDVSPFLHLSSFFCIHARPTYSCMYSSFTPWVKGTLPLSLVCWVNVI